MDALETLVRKNLMEQKGYSPYCGKQEKCSGRWPRTVFNGKQFVCPSCGWTSKFPELFIEQYKIKWNKAKETNNG